MPWLLQVMRECALTFAILMGCSCTVELALRQGHKRALAAAAAKQARAAQTSHDVPYGQGSSTSEAAAAEATAWGPAQARALQESMENDGSYPEPHRGRCGRCNQVRAHSRIGTRHQRAWYPKGWHVPMLVQPHHCQQHSDHAAGSCPHGLCQCQGAVPAWPPQR